MSITITCRCGKQLRAPDRAAGKRGKCPVCGNSLQILNAAPASTSTARQAVNRVAPPPTKPNSHRKVPEGPNGQSAPPPIASGATSSPPPLSRGSHHEGHESAHLLAEMLRDRPWIIPAAVIAVPVLIAVPAFFLVLPGDKSGNHQVDSSPDANRRPGSSTPAEPTTPDPKAQIAELEKQAEHGSAKSQAELGKLYSCGDGVDQDFYLAKNWFEKAANQNYAEAHYHLAFIHLRGEGGFQESRHAFFAHLRTAAAQGFSKAQDELVLGNIAIDG